MNSNGMKKELLIVFGELFKNQQNSQGKTNMTIRHITAYFKMFVFE